MKKYDSYKDSGIEWIGEIPSHWVRCRFKNFMYLKTEKSTSSVKIGLENIESGTGRYIASDTEFEGDGVGFIRNDIVYGKLRPYLMKVWQAEFEGNAVGDFFVFSSLSNSFPTYVKYLMLSDGFTKETNGSTNGAKMPRVDSEFILTLPFYLPTKEEQQSIASYLDEKCAAIDKVISTQQKRIELLKELKRSVITHAVTRGINPDVKMKDSGVEWIGMVPEHWEVKKMKFNFNVISGATPKSDFDQYWDGDIVWITPADYKTEQKFVCEGNRTITKEGYDSCNTQIVPSNSIIFSKRAPIGSVAISTVNLCTNQGCLSCVPLNANVTYFYYVMSICTEIFEILGRGTTFREISASTFENVKLPSPPIAEQKDIVAYVERETLSIDKTIEKALHQIDLLTELKQSIITEVVTGKRKVI